MAYLIGVSVTAAAAMLDAVRQVLVSGTRQWCGAVRCEVRCEVRYDAMAALMDPNSHMKFQYNTAHGLGWAGLVWAGGTGLDWTGLEVK